MKQLQVPFLIVLFHLILVVSNTSKTKFCKNDSWTVDCGLLHAVLPNRFGRRVYVPYLYNALLKNLYALLSLHIEHFEEVVTFIQFLFRIALVLLANMASVSFLVISALC